MSRWGDDFRQDVVDAIDELIDRDNSTRLDKMEAIFEAVAYMAENCFSRDKALQKMQEDALEKARSELMARVQNSLKKQDK
jgi:predicted proteasome-type protease